MNNDELRRILKIIDMKAIAEAASISHNILKNYSIGRKKELTTEEFIKVVQAIKELTTFRNN